MTNISMRRIGALTAIAAAALLAVAGCAPSAPAATPASEAVTITDAWVKAADEGMTAAFGELTNTSAQDVTIVSFQTPASPEAELHETVLDAAGAMTMREKDGGFTIPAGGSLVLEPGGNHLMLLGLVAPVLAGDDVEFTLVFSDGSELAFTAPAKDFSGANEHYSGGGMDSSSEMDMDGGN